MSPDFGDAPIQQDDFAEVPDPDIFGFDVAVDDASDMGVRQRLTGIGDDFDPPRNWHRGGGRRIAPSDSDQDSKQIFAADSFHGEKQTLAGVVTDVVHRDGVGVHQLSGHAGFA